MLQQVQKIKQEKRPSFAEKMNVNERGHVLEVRKDEDNIEKAMDMIFCNTEDFDGDLENLRPKEILRQLMKMHFKNREDEYFYQVKTSEYVFCWDTDELLIVKRQEVDEQVDDEKGKGVLAVLQELWVNELLEQKRLSLKVKFSLE